MAESLSFGYADPPYPGQSAKHYADHPDFDGEVGHAALIERLERDYDGWLLHTSSSALQEVLAVCPSGLRIFAWVKPFAAFKRNVSPAYAWEPVIVRPLRKGEPNQRSDSPVMRDWFSESITLKKGLTGVKPEKVCRWLFEAVGLRPEDHLHDLFPGTGAVTQTWERWRNERPLILEGLDAIFGEAEPVEGCEACGGRGVIHTGECREAMSGPTCRNPDCPPCQTPETEPCPDCQPEAER